MRFDTSLSLTPVDQLANFVTGNQHDGASRIVDFGSDAFMTLENVQSDQISWNDASVLS